MNLLSKWVKGVVSSGKKNIFGGNGSSLEKPVESAASQNAKFYVAVGENDNKDEILVMGTGYKDFPEGKHGPARTESTLYIPNEERSCVVHGIEISSILLPGEPIQKMTVAIQVEKKDLIMKKARENGIEFPSENNPDKWKGGLYLNKFNEKEYIGLFYAHPLDLSKLGEEGEFKMLKKKLLDTEFLGNDPKKRANLVEAMEKAAKVIFGAKDMPVLDLSKNGADRFIGNGKGREF
jgi:hypothetical protein